MTTINYQSTVKKLKITLFLSSYQTCIKAFLKYKYEILNIYIYVCISVKKKKMMKKKGENRDKKDWCAGGS